jgi:hypothetical protein
MSTSERLNQLDLEIHKISYQERLTIDGNSTFKYSLFKEYPTENSLKENLTIVQKKKLQANNKSRHKPMNRWDSNVHRRKSSQSMSLIQWS